MIDNIYQNYKETIFSIIGLKPFKFDNLFMFIWIANTLFLFVEIFLSLQFHEINDFLMIILSLMIFALLTMVGRKIKEGQSEKENPAAHQ